MQRVKEMRDAQKLEISTPVQPPHESNESTLDIPNEISIQPITFMDDPETFPLNVTR